MRSYGTIKPSFWTGPTGRAIREAGASVQLAAVYLMTSPHANMFGLYYLPLVLVAKETALTKQEASRAMHTLQSLKFADYDPESETIWVIEMAKYQLGVINERDGRVKAIQRAYADLQVSPFLGPFFEKYSGSLCLVHRREGTPRGTPTVPLGGTGSGPVPGPVPDLLRTRFERFWSGYPRKVGKDAAWSEWQRVAPGDDLTDQMLAALLEQRASAQWLKDDGQFIPHPRTWLHQGRWQDTAQIEAAPQAPDMHGHLPPCRTRDDCNRRHFEEVTGKRAQA